MSMNYAEMIGREFEEESPQLKEARLKYPKDSWVYINTTKELGTVVEISESLDGILLKINQMGTVPETEVRPATKEEIKSKTGS